MREGQAGPDAKEAKGPTRCRWSSEAITPFRHARSLPKPQESGPAASLAPSAPTSLSRPPNPSCLALLPPWDHRQWRLHSLPGTPEGWLLLIIWTSAEISPLQGVSPEHPIQINHLSPLQVCSVPQLASTVASNHMGLSDFNELRDI